MTSLNHIDLLRQVKIKYSHSIWFYCHAYFEALNIIPTDWQWMVFNTFVSIRGCALFSHILLYMQPPSVNIRSEQRQFKCRATINKREMWCLK